MTAKRSKGVIFWGILLMVWGVLFALMKAIADRWDFDSFLPPVFIIIGFGIIVLKNWARIASLALMIFEIFLSTFIFTLILLAHYFPRFIVRPNEILSSQAFLISIFMIRFTIGITGLIFFTRPSVKNQFNKGGNIL